MFWVTIRPPLANQGYVPEVRTRADFMGKLGGYSEVNSSMMPNPNKTAPISN